MEAKYALEERGKVVRKSTETDATDPPNNETETGCTEVSSDQ